MKKISVKFVAWTARWDLNYITLTTYIISLCACILYMRAASMGFSSILLAGTFLAVVWRDLDVVSSPSVSNTSNGLFISYTRRICSRLLAKLISTDIYLPSSKIRTHQQSQRALIRLINRDKNASVCAFLNIREQQLCRFWHVLTEESIFPLWCVLSHLIAVGPGIWVGCGPIAHYSCNWTVIKAKRCWGYISIFRFKWT